MSNGARHGLGVLVGLIGLPVILGLLIYSADRSLRNSEVFSSGTSDRWLGAALLAAAALVVGLLAASRVSPVAALIPGLLLTANGLLWVAKPAWLLRHSRDVLPNSLERGYFGSIGILLAVGVVLLVSALPPSRWRSTAASPRTGMASQPAPFGPPPGPPRYERQPQPQQQPQHQQYQPQPQQQHQPQHQPQQGVPPYDPSAQPFGAPQAPPPAAPQSSPQGGAGGPGGAGGSARPGTTPDDDEPGEWTRIYGGRNS